MISSRAASSHGDQVARSATGGAVPDQGEHDRRQRYPQVPPLPDGDDPAFGPRPLGLRHLHRPRGP
jgi:hypothetical protein